MGGHMNYKPGGGVGGHTSLVHVRGGAIIPPSWGKRKPALRNKPGGYQKRALHGPEEDYRYTGAAIRWAFGPPGFAVNYISSFVLP